MDKHRRRPRHSESEALMRERERERERERKEGRKEGRVVGKERAGWRGDATGAAANIGKELRRKERHMQIFD